MATAASCVASPSFQDAAEPVALPHCWSAIPRLLSRIFSPAHFAQEIARTLENRDEEPGDVETEEGQLAVEMAEAGPVGGAIMLLTYGSSREAMEEIQLDGGDGDHVVFHRIKPGSCAEQAGARPGDEVTQINLIDPSVLFWKPAEEILKSIQGPILLWWRSAPKPDPAHRTRIHEKRPKNWEELAWDGLWDEKYPKSKAYPLGTQEWSCPGCGGCTNYNNQEFCRRCGFRDTRLPRRPGSLPKPGPDRADMYARQAPPLLFGSEGITEKDIREAAIAT